jgi:hypothetical protein
MAGKLSRGLSEGFFSLLSAPHLASPVPATVRARGSCEVFDGTDLEAMHQIEDPRGNLIGSYHNVFLRKIKMQPGPKNP